MELELQPSHATTVYIWVEAMRGKKNMRSLGKVFVGDRASQIGWEAFLL